MKRFFMITITLAMLMTMTTTVAVADQSQTVKLTYWAALEFADVLTSFDDVVPYNVAQENLGIDIEWQHPPVGQESEQFNLLVASSDMPDIVEYPWNQNYPGGAEAAIENGVIIELNDVIENYMPNYKAYAEAYPEVAKMVVTDTGKNYNIPYIYTVTPDGQTHQSISGRQPAYETFMGLFIRQDLLDEFGLQMPVTMDDWYTTLKAFKENGVATPLTGVWSQLAESNAFVSAFDISHDFFVDADGKTVRFGRTEPAYKDYLAYMNKLYDEGLLDPDFAIIDATTVKAKILNQETGAWSGYTSTFMGVQYDQIHADNPDSKFYPVGATNPKQSADQTLMYRQASYPYRNSGAAITASCQNVEAAAKFLDYFWSDEGDMLINWGVEGESYQFNDAGTPTFTDKIKNDPNGLSPTNAFAFWRKQNGPFAMDHQTRLMSKGAYGTPESINALHTWETTNGTNPAMLPPVTLLPDETTTFAIKNTEIMTYANEMRIKFIMGQTSLDEFDAYVSQIENMGLNEVMTIEQNALDRYNAR